MAKYKKGESGNPKGRPPGVPDRRTRLRELLEDHAEAIIKKLTQKAKAGDMQAIKICVERLLPPAKHDAQPPAPNIAESWAEWQKNATPEMYADMDNEYLDMSEDLD